MLINKQSNVLINKINQDETYKQEFTNSLKSLPILEHKIENQIYQLNPSINISNITVTKTKRGIINPLGSIIKCITGNLDNSDAEYYDEQIKQLQLNQNNLKKNLLNQVTLLETTIDKFQDLVYNISHNQNKLESNIMHIQEIIEKVSLQEITSHQFYKINILINQFIFMYQTISDILTNVEVAISFAKLNTLHNSIVNPLELLSEINKFKHHLNLDVLPLESNIENLLNIEQIIEIKSYVKESTIVFILELPLVKLDVFQYYQLYPVPIPENPFEFYINFPHTPYLALNEEKYSYLNQHCKNLQKQEYLCKEVHLLQANPNSPCAVQLLNYQSNITNCAPLKIEITETQILKITDNKWIVTTPNKTVTSIMCGDLKSNKILFGSYLIEINNNCIVQINSIKLQTYKAGKLLFNKIQLPTVNLSTINNNRNVKLNVPNLNLGVINFKETNDLKKKIRQQENRIEEMNNPVYANKTSIFTIFLYIILIIFLAVLIIKTIIFKFKNIKNKIISNNEVIV